MSSKINIQYYKSPVGELILGDFEGKLCLADWRYRKMRPTVDKRIQSQLNADYQEKNTALIEETIRQFAAYFVQKLEQFDLPLHFVGTDFQQSVWEALCEIPFGKTMSYLELSKKMNKEKAIRAVATANGANAISIIVPCHRIIGSDGKLVGYAGGLPAKKKLLQLENALTTPQMSLF